MNKQAKTDGSRPSNARYKREELEDTLKKLGCEPLIFTANVMMGRALTTSHPFMSVVDDLLELLLKMNFGPQTDKMAQIMISFGEKAHRMLSDSYTPPDMRMRAAIELMQYIYSKRKAIELTDPTGQIPQEKIDEVVKKYESLFADDNEVKRIN